MKKVAISACLMGHPCRYDATDNLDVKLLDKLESYVLIPFCPEVYAFGSPRPTMDLIQTDSEYRAICNESGEDRSGAIEQYAKEFFGMHPDIDLYIGKDRSPSCGVCSAKIYDNNRKLLSQDGVGLMSIEANKREIELWDAENYIDDLGAKE